MKTIVITTPYPFLPVAAGNQARITAMISLLMEMGCLVHVVLIERKNAFESDIPAMRSFINGSLHLVPCNVEPRPFWWVRLKQALSKSPLPHDYPVDSWLEESSARQAGKIIDSLKPNFVIVNYVFDSRIFRHCSGPAIKFLDVHDLFCHRNAMRFKFGSRDNWFSTSFADELKGLRRADVILEIRKDEFRRYRPFLAGTKVVHLGHIPHCEPPRQASAPDSLLFVGADNPMNMDTLTWFQQTILPQIHERVPAQLHVAGDVCRRVKPAGENTVYHQHVTSLKELYQSVKVVINPVRFGSGLKIKNIEAMAHGKALVTSSVGAQGMEDGANRAFLMTDDPAEFSEHVVALCRDDALRERLERQAFEYAGSWRHRQIETMNNLLDLTGASGGQRRPFSR